MTILQTHHNLDEIYLLLDQIKGGLKPAPKTFIEMYGVLIGALIGVLSSILTFLLSTYKEYFFKKKDNWKYDKEVRSKIFADIMEVNNEFIETIKERDMKIVNIKYYENLIFKCDIKDKRTLTELMALNQEQHLELENKLNSLKKIYFAKVSNYLFHKELNTEVAELQKRLRGAGLKFKADEYDSTDVQYCNEYYKLQKHKASKFWSEEILQPSGLILEAILKNK